MESAIPRGGDPEQPPIYLPKPGEAPKGIMMAAKGGRVKRDNGGIMNLGGLEKDYRFSGGFVPIGEYEKKMMSQQDYLKMNLYSQLMQ